MTSLNWSMPSLCRCANIAMSRRVKVDCCCVIASSATEGSAMIRRRCCGRSRGACRRGRLRFDPFALDPLRRCADLALRLKPDALRLKAAMVDARVDVEFGQGAR
jgi:hypothetical protein